MIEAVSWNGSNGHRTLMHLRQEEMVTLCGNPVSQDEDAEIECRSDWPVTRWSKKNRRRLCHRCIAKAKEFNAGMNYGF